MGTITKIIEPLYRVSVDLPKTWDARPHWWKNFIISIKLELDVRPGLYCLAIQVNSHLAPYGAWVSDENKIYFATKEDFIVFKLKWS